MNRKAGISRREFARRAALASAAASLVPASALEGLGQSSSSVAEATEGKIPSVSELKLRPPFGKEKLEETAAAPAGQQTETALSPESQAEVDARVQTILSQYGSRFSEEQKAEIRQMCAAAQPGLDHLRAYELENGDAPALYLKPLVEREKKPAPEAAPPKAG